MATDAAFLDEVTEFLETEALCGVSTPKVAAKCLQATSSLVTPLGTLRSSRHSDKGSHHVDRREKYRQKIKSEREELRKERRQLFTTLERLKQEKQARTTTPRTDLALSGTFWRDVALRQREKRQQAENEQKRLMTVINSQAVYLKSLSEVFQNSLKGSDAAVHGIDESKWLRMKSSDIDVFKQFIEEIDADYARTDDVFENSGLASMSEGVAFSEHQRMGDGAAEYFQYRIKLRYPFAFEQTCRYMWGLSTLSHRQQDRQVYEDIPDPTNTIAFTFRYSQTLTGGSTASILKRLVARRFVQDNRMVIMWKIFAEGEGIFSGMDRVETSWTSIRPSDDKPDTETVLEICFHQVPVTFCTLNPGPQAVDQFREMLQGELQDDEAEITTAMEKLFITDALNNAVKQE